MRAKRFSELSPAGRLWASVLLVISLTLIGAAQRDLQHRSAGELRGSKLIWRILCLNGLGALAYFGWGRRPSGS